MRVPGITNVRPDPDTSTYVPGTSSKQLNSPGSTGNMYMCVCVLDVDGCCYYASFAQKKGMVWLVEKNTKYVNNTYIRTYVVEEKKRPGPAACSDQSTSLLILILLLWLLFRTLPNPAPTYVYGCFCNTRYRFFIFSLFFFFIYSPADG